MTQITLKEGRRWPGSEWLKNRPQALARLYEGAKVAFAAAYPVMRRVSPGATNRVMIWVEEAGKGYVFNCRMCGQCILHSTGMTCPMNCPKNLRNGPCGGVRADGHCEVIPARPCVWVQAWERSRQMSDYQDEILLLQAPVNRSLHGTSSWINMAEEIDTKTPAGWRD